MDLLHSVSHISAVRFIHSHRFIATRTARRLNVRSSLPFLEQKAKYYEELQAAVDVVERACRLCIDGNDTRLMYWKQLIKDACAFGSKRATYWVLDPIDGTRRFVKASKALYVAWDHAVGMIYIQEAGGKILQQIKLAGTGGVFVTHGNLHH